MAKILPTYYGDDKLDRFASENGNNTAPNNTAPGGTKPNLPGSSDSGTKPNLPGFLDITPVRVADDGAGSVAIVPAPTQKPSVEQPPKEQPSDPENPSGEKPSDEKPGGEVPTVPESSGYTSTPFEHPAFDPLSDPLIKQAYDSLSSHMDTMPVEWVDPYEDKWSDYLSKYENRDPFSYDFNADALYNQYKDQYIQQGRMAMMDTMGQAAAMTGGYGNSYAQTAGQQAYNQQLGQLNEIMPELYDRAYNRYNQEGEDLLNMYGAYLGLSEQDYGRHQDAVDNWYQEMDRLTNDYNTLYDRGWNEYVLGYNTAYDEHAANQGRAFTESQNALDRADANRDREYTRITNMASDPDYKPTQAELDAAGMTEAEFKAIQNSYKSSGNENPLSFGDASEWRNTLYSFEKKGDYAKIEREINHKLRNGYISEDEAIALFEEFGLDDK